jgi:phosphopentomutase
MSRRAAIVVLDGVGIGEAPDAVAYGDSGSNTLGNIARRLGGLELPALQAAGLGNIAEIDGVPPADRPAAAHGSMRPASAGKDSTTGHWEIAGLHLDRPFPTYPEGFPGEVVDEFSGRTGRPVIGNVVGSGTDVIDRFGEEHLRTGGWILYTSADSVFQVAAHEEMVPLAELHAACETARSMLVRPHDVARVIARPFEGVPGRFRRTANRRDYSIAPPGETLLDALAVAGIARAGVGKVDDLFAGRSISSIHTSSNAEGISGLQEWLSGAVGGFLFVNLVDFDQLYGHRNDAVGFYRALREFDGVLPALVELLGDNDLLFLTADHGNDPTTLSTDHAREHVPVLAFGAAVAPISVGTRPTFSDLGATVAEWMGIDFRGRGTSFLPEITRA